jgi:hypothetical protein
MKRVFRKVAVALGLLLTGTILTLQANAACVSLDGLKPGASVHPQSFEGENYFGADSLLLVSDHDQDSIVGMWKVTVTAQGNTGPGAPPDGAILDSAFAQWHSDGTEIMNSGRPPQDGSFCMGVWEKTGRSRYRLNHFAIGNDTANAPGGIGNPTGPTHLVEDVILSRDGNHYAGAFIVDAYDLAGNNVAHILGHVSATRITINTPVSSVL